MKLAPLLATLSDEDLDRLALEHVRTDKKLPRLQLCDFLEGALRSYRFVHDFIVNRQPPTFAMLTLLLDAGNELPLDGFRERVMAETLRLATLIDSGDVLARDNQLHLYRRALYEARRNDFDLNASEAALLAVLRRESGIAQVEHFLIEHHADLREFWNKDDSFDHEQTALLSAGIVFIREGKVLIPEEIAPAVWQTLGIDMPTESARRLFGYLSSGELATALEAAGSRISGTKESRLERMLTERIQPRTVLSSVALSTLKEICRETDASVSGNKDDLVDRIIGHFAQGKDQRVEEPVEPPRKEPRQLKQHEFETLFSALLHQELTDILRRFPELRQTGTKEVRIRTLWDAHLSEHTLLAELMNRDLESVLHRLGLRLSGSKGDRIDRIIVHFGGSIRIDSDPRDPETAGAIHAPSSEASPQVLANQALFAQKASNPQASLQPWLEELLEAPGLIRCYATEDENPTKQLKNKLSQAAAARDGVLVLTLSDKSSFEKAREALVERWMTNAEWPKSVACVALAYPLAAPVIGAIVEHGGTDWTSRLRGSLFPTAKAFRVGANEQGDIGPKALCARCGQSLPSSAKFCPECGLPTA
jgi:hypothetical protein